MARTDVTSLVCAKKNTALLVRYCDDLTCATPKTQSNVAFVLFSTGRNLVNQTGAATSPHTEALSSDPSESGPDGTPASPRTITLYATGAAVGVYSATSTSPTENDDMVTVVTLEDLRNKLNCQDLPLRIVNSDLPTGAASTTYTSTIFADGGVPVAGTAGNYRWCAESSASVALSAIASLKIVAADGTETAGAISASGSCSSAVESAWSVGQSVRFHGAGASDALSTTVAGTYDLTVYVRDDQNPDATVTGTTDQKDNITSRKFVLGVNGS